MLRQHLFERCRVILAIRAPTMSLVDTLVCLKDLWFDGKLALALQGIPLNLLLAMIVVVLGLSAIIATPILSFLVLGAVAFFLPFNRRATTKFVTMGGLSTAFGALTIVDLPLSPITSMRFDGAPFATTFLATLNSYTLFGIAAIGLLSLGLQIELTPVQRDTLTALVHLHRQESRAVKGEEIAELTDRNPGTIRNQMQSLKALNLVESVTGPRGGYKATGAAFEALSMDISISKDEAVVPIIRNGIVVESASVSEIVFSKIMHSTHQCSGLIRIIGNIKDFKIGDEVEVGPTPVNRLFISGKVMGRDDATSRLILDITGIISVPKIPVKKIAKRAIRISPKASIREASRMLVHNGAREALVEDSPPGLINLEDITRAVAKGGTDLAVREIMSRSFLTINSDELIFEAIKMLSKTGANQLVVVENGMPWGILSPRDIIKSLTPT